MFLLSVLFAGLLNVVLLMLDITVFFLAVRLLAVKWPVRTILAFDTAGQALVGVVTDILNNAFERFRMHHVSQKTTLIVGILALGLIQCVLYLLLAGLR